jgi:hypothetical protein
LADFYLLDEFVAHYLKSTNIAGKKSCKICLTYIIWFDTLVTLCWVRVHIFSRN